MVEYATRLSEPIAPRPGPACACPHPFYSQFLVSEISHVTVFLSDCDDTFEKIPDVMLTSALATDRWEKILSRKKYDITSVGSDEALRLVNDRESFRDIFEKECDRINYKWAQRALGKLDNSFDHLESFILILGAATLDRGNKGYIGLIWGACFAVIHVSVCPFLFYCI